MLITNQKGELIMQIEQHILDKVLKDIENEKKDCLKKGKHLTKQEMILLFNILNNLYDTFDTNTFGCTKQEYRNIITRLDALTD